MAVEEIFKNKHSIATVKTLKVQDHTEIKETKWLVFRMIHVKDSLLARVNFWFLDFWGKNMSHLCRKDGQIPLLPLPCQRFTWNSPEKKGMSLFLSKYVFFSQDIYVYGHFPKRYSKQKRINVTFECRWHVLHFLLVAGPQLNAVVLQGSARFAQGSRKVLIVQLGRC